MSTLTGKEIEPTMETRAKWTVQTRIEKFHTQESLDKGVPDEVLEVPSNCLCNEGVNTLWCLVAGLTKYPAAVSDFFTEGKDIIPFGTNSCIGVGDAGDDGTSMAWASTLAKGQDSVAAATDKGLYAGAAHRMYMKMDDSYPIAGQNQKIVFRSTFLPGIACFKWLEWTIANGNGNIKTGGTFSSDAVRMDANTTGGKNEPIPDPLPELGTSHDYGVTEDEIINLNHKIESMGEKYPSSTWIVSVEVSLS